MSTKKLQIIGGNFGGNVIQIDDTLTQPGQAADSKATGDAINQLQVSIDEVVGRVGDLNGEYYTEQEIDSIVDNLNATIDAKSDADHIHDDLYYTETEIDDRLEAMQSNIDSKVDVVDGMGLSTNDYTTAEKDKLATIEDNANFYEHPVHTSHDSGLYKVTVDGEGHVSSVTLAEKEDIVALGIPAQDTTYEEEISDLNDRIDDVENGINITNETLSGLSEEFESYKTTNNEAVATNTSAIEVNKTTIEEIQSDYLTSTDKTQLQDEISKVSEKATANTSAIEILNGEGDGSVKQFINNAFNEFAANVTNDDVINTYKELIDYAAAHGPEFTELVGKVDNIDTHVGEIETDLSDYKTIVSEQFTEIDTTINDHVADENNPHNVTKDQIGLDQVDNTSDLDKPISRAVDEALQGKADVEHMHEIGHVDSLQEFLDELRAGIDTITEDVATKADLEHNHDDLYYDKEEILGLITVEDIDNICESVQGSDEPVDLIKVATSEWVQANYQPKGNYLTKVPDGYATEAFVENKIADINADVGNVNDLQTVEKNLTGAVNEVLTAVDAVSSAAAITLTTKGASGDFSNVYELKQGDNVIGNINIIKDMVVQSGEVVDVDGVKNIKLVLQNIDNPLYIPVGSLVDVYVAKAEAAQVQVVVDSNTREISAHIVAGSVTATELAADAVVTAKIADANVTKAKLSAEVQASLDKADVAEKNAKDYTDSLDNAMDVRMLAVEAKLIDVSGRSSHEHENKEELDLIASGDKAKWDNAVIDLADEIVRAKAAEDANATAIARANIELQKKVASINAGNNSISVEGTATAPTISVQLSQDDDNIIELVEDGLKVVAPAVVEYTIEKIDGATDYDAIYHLMKNGEQVGASISIPKNMVVKSGYVEDGNIVLILNDETDTQIVIPADSLITHITSGSTDADMIVINVSEDYEVTASITNGSITADKLSLDIMDCLNEAHSHENADILDSITADKVAAWDASSIEVDTTLSIEGMAADAKAVGDAINDAGSIDVNFNDANSGDINPINADTLGGIHYSDYATINNMNDKIRKAAPYNLLDNSDFTNIINQRGQSSYTGTTIAYDRWMTRRVTISASNNGLSIIPNDESGLRYIYQRINKNLCGRKITVAIDGMPNGGYIKLFNLATEVVIAESEPTNEGLNIFVAEIPTGYEDGMTILFYIPDNSSAILKWAALYEGEYTIDTIPEYQPKGYAAELMECQRYCFVSSYNATDMRPFYGNFSSSTVFNAYLSLPVPMRTNPSISNTSGENWKIISGGKTYIPLSINSWFVTKNGLIGIKANLTDGVTSEVGIMYPGSATKVIFSADL